jgi:hypothetical protein
MMREKLISTQNSNAAQKILHEYLEPIAQTCQFNMLVEQLDCSVMYIEHELRISSEILIYIHTNKLWETNTKYKSWSHYINNAGPLKCLRSLLQSRYTGLSERVVCNILSPFKII